MKNKRIVNSYKIYIMKYLNVFRGIFLSLMLLGTSVASAHDFEVDGVFYDITSLSSSNLEVCVTIREVGIMNFPTNTRLVLPFLIVLPIMERFTALQA